MAPDLKTPLPHIDTYQDRHGKRRYYFRRNRASKRVSLPGEPGSPEFVAAYAAAQAQPEPPRALPSTTAKAGSLDALRLAYYGSAEFKTLADSSRREIRYILDAVCSEPNKDGSPRGGNPVTLLERKHILAWRDKLADRPGAANNMTRAVKVWLSFAKERGYRSDNPAFGIKPLKIGRIRAWTDAELAAFEQRWPLGTLERTGYALALYTAQRRSDLVKMKWTAIAGDTIHVKQQKTGTDLEIYLHPDLCAALAGVTRCSEFILTGSAGHGLSAIYFGHVMAAAIDAAGLPRGCVLHGLRKTAARIVAETGGRVRSMTGHLSPRMEREYEDDAAQRIMSKATVLKWTQGRKKDSP